MAIQLISDKPIKECDTLDKWLIGKLSAFMTV